MLEKDSAGPLLDQWLVHMCMYTCMCACTHVLVETQMHKCGSQQASVSRSVECESGVVCLLIRPSEGGFLKRDVVAYQALLGLGCTLTHSSGLGWRVILPSSKVCMLGTHQASRSSPVSTY